MLYKKASSFSHVEFDVYENWQKMSFRNRCILAGSGGPVSLSIPLEEGRGQRKLTRDVRISNRYPWQTQHWKTIVSCYNRSPWFEFYRDELELLYQQSFEFLVDWNLACWRWSVKKLGWSVSTGVTAERIENLDVTKWLDFRNELLPKSIMHKFPDPVMYQQVFEDRIGFLPHCSILDLLFCEGKNARAVLSK
ncbi:WbqC family protein [Paraflavitalea sp. CAU 1676]|uniref:WbqC family protein n=1 Tax=Paraflavitalea sp. CAU 1676 TaxID=3032598 RepID=UPI0023DB55C1|nr:WbqC family protein [Paraflavitalea sp. CAU 1676]MDF2191967.1 WbqC family protein [Paraflavitalea sp. CAU 1676]